MKEIVDNARTSLNSLVWAAPLEPLPPARRTLLRALRTVHMLLREISEGTLTLRAASLVFTTLLSLVPLLAVSFSLLRAFGVRNKLESVLLGFLDPLGDKGQEIGRVIVGFVDQVNVGMLGGIGLVILLLTVMSLIQKVEASLNACWRVGQTRSFAQRFSGYLSVLLVGPLLAFAAAGLIGTTMSTPLVQSLAEVEPLGTLLTLLPKLIPYALMIAAFAFVYSVMPNTKVRPRSALVGGCVAGVLWATAGWGFAVFIVNSPTSSYAAIYSSFAIVFFFMLWIYVAWLILLIGGSVAFYDQHPEYLGVMPGELRVSNRLRERIALAAMVLIGRRHRSGGPAPDAVELAESMRLPASLVQETLESLTRSGFVALIESPRVGYLPARDMGAILLSEILISVRSAHENRELVPDRLPAEPVVESLMDELEQGAAAVLGSRSLRDLVGDPQEREAVRPGLQLAPKSAR